MKKFTFILAFLFLYLAIIPCADAITSAEDCSTEVHKDLSEEHERDTHIEVCSPFCSCHCCKVHIVKLELPTHYFISSIAKNKSFITAVLLSRKDFAVWHPPTV